MTDLIIYGAGGLGREILGYVRAIDPLRARWNFLGFADDGVPAGTPVGGDAVLGGMEYLSSLGRPVSVVMGLGGVTAKAAVYAKLSPNPGIEFPILVHPLAYVEPSASLAPGVIISPFCFVAVNSSLGICSFMNVTAYVGHDSVVCDFCSIMPSAGISGNVKIGARTMVGAGAKILQGLEVGEDAVVGIGSVVLDNVPPRCTVLGNPAKIVKRRPGA